MPKAIKEAAPKGYVSGEYAVGTKCFSIVDTNRKNMALIR